MSTQNGESTGIAATIEGSVGAERLRALAQDLRTLLAESEQEIGKLGRNFEDLARETSAVVETAGVIVSCVESDRVALVLPGVAKLAEAAQGFIRGRLDATADVVETVGREQSLLEQLSQFTRGQKAIVRETGMLRVLTNIEVARLGEVGAGFQYLAHELDDFSQSVARSTNELTEHTDERRKAITETQRTLSAELPAMREGFARIEDSLGRARTEVEALLDELRQTPSRFRACVQEVVGQIDGVVAAIQAHDITRQQIEHVEAALATIAEDLAGGEPETEPATGLAIQSYQLRNVQRTMEGWTAQIRSCLEGIGRIASSEIVDLGPMVVRQESALSAQLTRIEQLEEECEAGDARVQASFAGIRGLMQLVSEHLERSKAVRDRLQLLMFNSIVEASHLGTQADGILEISTTIKRISAAWGEITRRSEAATGEIRALVEASQATVEAFSATSYLGLREARSETEAGLEVLRDAAHCAETRGGEVESAVRGLQARIAEIGATGDRLAASFRRLETAQGGIESLRVQLGEEAGVVHRARDAQAVEERFSRHYTTEMERAVLRAALEGGPLPAAQESFAGNTVELF